MFVNSVFPLRPHPMCVFIWLVLLIRMLYNKTNYKYSEKNAKLIGRNSFDITDLIFIPLALLLGMAEYPYICLLLFGFQINNDC